ncbi:MAG: hypothetical protein WDM71_05545 [Ferruginibacter sp.]
MRKIFLLSVIVLFVAVIKVNAQDKGTAYTTAVGIKLAPATALTVKHFINDDNAIEGLASFWSHGFRLTGLYEFHHDISDMDGLKWYVGPGIHFSAYGSKYYGGGSTVGVDGVLGLDYKFDEAPINLSLDWQPSVDFGSYDGFDDWFGLGIRYTFN